MRRESQNGLTLLEVLLAFTIMSVLVTLCYKILQKVGESKIIVEQIDEGMTIGNSILNRIVRELQLAARVSQVGLLPRCDQGGVLPSTAGSTTTAPAATTPNAAGAPTPLLVLRGDEQSGAGGRQDQITFIAKEGGQYLPDGGKHTGLVQITYRVERNPDAPQESNPTFLLIRDEMPYLQNQARACAQAIRFPITDRLVNLRFSYYNQRLKSWSESWGSMGLLGLPSVVDFTLTIRTLAGRVETFGSAISIRAER